MVRTQLQGDPSTAPIPVILPTAKVQNEDVPSEFKMGTDY